MANTRTEAGTWREAIRSPLVNRASPRGPEARVLLGCGDTVLLPRLLLIFVLPSGRFFPDISLVTSPFIHMLVPLGRTQCPHQDINANVSITFCDFGAQPWESWGLWLCGSLSGWALQAWGAPRPWSPRQSGFRLGSPRLTPPPGLLKAGTAPRHEAGAGGGIFIHRKHMKQTALRAQETLQNQCPCEV